MWINGHCTEGQDFIFHNIMQFLPYYIWSPQLTLQVPTQSRTGTGARLTSQSTHMTMTVNHQEADSAEHSHPPHPRKCPRGHGLRDSIYTSSSNTMERIRVPGTSRADTLGAGQRLERAEEETVGGYFLICWFNRVIGLWQFTTRLQTCDGTFLCV